jgi:long-subunit fatty acid transport protein
MKGPVRWARIARVLGVVVGIGSGAVYAQSLTSLEFSFSNPGARSLGFGGAFVALADDATAAFANPAGLVQIAAPEISMEGRRWSYSTPYTRGGRVVGRPTGIGIDVSPEPLTGESMADLSGLSYLSFVYPFEHWSLAVYQHQLANFEFAIENQGLFGSSAGLDVRSPPQLADLDIDVLTRGLAFAFRPLEKLSFGLAVNYHRTSSSFLGLDYRSDSEAPWGRYGEASFDPEHVVQSVRLEMDDSDWTLSAGLLWRVAERWSVGAFYRQAPTSVYLATVEAGPASTALPPGFRLADEVPLDWDFPDVFGLGAAFRSRSGRWTAAFEWDRVRYSTLLANLLPQQREPGLELNDADELRLGGEYAFFAGSTVVAARLGVWHDPDHQFGTTADPASEPFAAALLPGGEDELHVAAGAGIGIGRFQVDAALDVSERVDTASLSAIYSF